MIENCVQKTRNVGVSEQPNDTDSLYTDLQVLNPRLQN